MTNASTTIFQTERSTFGAAASIDRVQFFCLTEMNVKLSKSNRKGKKLMAEFPDGSRIHFGAAGMSDFTKHKDPERKSNYLARHKHDPKSIRTAGGLARDILWSRPNLGEAVKYAEKKHGVNIVLDTHLRRK